jgi:hypothetical protein
MSGLTVSDELMAAAQSTAMRAEIQNTWGRFSTEEISALTDNQDLVRLLRKKYRLGQFQAELIVEEFARGRQL